MPVGRRRAREKNQDDLSLTTNGESYTSYQFISIVQDPQLNVSILLLFPLTEIFPLLLLLLLLIFSGPKTYGGSYLSILLVIFFQTPDWWFSTRTASEMKIWSSFPFCRCNSCSYIA
ncbi:hypothetical protein CEXT_269871 [Caerostris extrusa]|uniref:Uncharacterized protein n=1 Tax=Caerostris extrusa TaxID=172846 RepID=A0AAV4TBV0_CAEEX|nr:hypothetical protein CEXT_269871 [Caerostris extrusa]